MECQGNSGATGETADGLFLLRPRLEKPWDAKTNKTYCDNYFLYINSLIKNIIFKGAATND